MENEHGPEEVSVYSTDVHQQIRLCSWLFAGEVKAFHLVTGGNFDIKVEGATVKHFCVL